MSGTAPLLVWNGIVARIATAVEGKPVELLDERAEAAQEPARERAMHGASERTRSSSVRSSTEAASATAR